MHNARFLTVFSIAVALAVGTALFVTGTARHAAATTAFSSSLFSDPTGPSPSGQNGTHHVRSAFGESRSVTTQLIKGSVDPQTVHRPDEADSGTETASWSSLDEFMTFVVDDTAAVWNWYYEQWGYDPGGVNYVWVPAGQTAVTTCDDSVIDADTSPFYCASDDTIFFGMNRAVWYWEKAGGDFGLAAAIAHEYGHNVQHELGISEKTYGVTRHELHADCFAGAFAHVAYYQGILDSNDVSEGMTSRYLVGDFEFDNPQHHGTPEERAAAFKLGYDAAGPAGCDSLLFD
jgi:predicted metalloprotease